MYRYVRAEISDLDDETAPFFIDLLLNEHGLVKEELPYLGWWGNHKSTAVLPFIVKNLDDTYCLDFGSDEDTDQRARYELFCLLDGPVEVGKRFKQRYGNDWYSLRVKRIIDMVDGKSIE